MIGAQPSSSALTAGTEQGGPQPQPTGKPQRGKTKEERAQEAADKKAAREEERKVDPSGVAIKASRTREM